MSTIREILMGSVHEGCRDPRETVFDDAALTGVQCAQARALCGVMDHISAGLGRALTDGYYPQWIAAFCPEPWDMAQLTSAERFDAVSRLYGWGTGLWCDSHGNTWGV